MYIENSQSSFFTLPKINLCLVFQCKYILNYLKKYLFSDFMLKTRTNRCQWAQKNKLNLKLKQALIFQEMHSRL